LLHPNGKGIQVKIRAAKTKVRAVCGYPLVHALGPINLLAANFGTSIAKIIK
jgi:hypothetical protein